MQRRVHLRDEPNLAAQPGQGEGGDVGAVQEHLPAPRATSPQGRHTSFRASQGAGSMTRS